MLIQISDESYEKLRLIANGYKEKTTMLSADEIIEVIADELINLGIKQIGGMMK